MTTVVEDQKAEILVFGDAHLKDDMTKRLEPLNVVIDRRSYALGMPLRITTEQVSKDFFKIPLEMWKESKGTIRMTFRFSEGVTVQVTDSNLSKIEELISKLQ